MEQVKLNLGCGSETPDGWINVDYSLGARIAKLPIISNLIKALGLFKLEWDKDIYLHDLRKPFPWGDETIDMIYSSHTLEHLSKTEGQHFLKESYRVLKRGGVVRIIVPDLESFVKRYIDGDIPADDFLDSLQVGYTADADSFLKATFAPFVRFPHKCMYDSKGLQSLMEGVGYSASSKKAFESEIERIEDIEIESRIVGAVIVEGIKV